MYEIEYNGEKIPYKIINSKIKNMYIEVKVMENLALANMVHYMQKEMK